MPCPTCPDNSRCERLGLCQEAAKQQLPGPEPAGGAFSPEEARRGYAMRNGVKAYCCYGMYCEAGHSPECKHARGSTEVPRG